MTRVAIVCGYDLHADLETYSMRVSMLLDGTPFDAVVLSGGRTSPRTEHSEAWMMARSVAHDRLILEENALTTLDNLVFAKELMRREVGPVESWIVFCDRAHFAKVRMLSRLILGRTAEVRSVERRVPWPIRAFEPISFVVEGAAALFSPLRLPLRLFAMWAKGLDADRRRRALRAIESFVTHRRHSASFDDTGGLRSRQQMQ